MLGQPEAAGDHTMFRVKNPRRVFEKLNSLFFEVRKIQPGPVDPSQYDAPPIQ